MPDEATSPAGAFALKNTLDFSDDTILFDASDNPISFMKNVVAQAATPNSFRTRKRFYGRFIVQLWNNGSAGKEGDGMWDDVLAALKRASGESTQEMNLFVGIVHIEELQSYPFPEASDWDAIMKIAVNGGIFKSYVYSGLPPAYGDNVLVSFADPATRSEGVFEHPLVGGAAAGSIGAGGAAGGSTSGGASFGSCRRSPPARARRPSGAPAATAATPAAATSTPAAAPAAAATPQSSAPAPAQSTVKSQTPDVVQPESALPRCTAKGGKIFWIRSGKASDMPQIGPNRTFGTDWSGWNRITRLPFDKLKAEGIEFSMIKLTQGKSRANRFVEGQISGAKSEGILIGPYHFCGSQKQGNPETLARREYEVFEREITKSGRDWDLAPALDFESGQVHTGRRHKPYMPRSAAACALHNLRFYVKFCQLLKARFHVKPMIYTAGWARGAYMNGMKGSDLYKELGRLTTLWWAEYDRSGAQAKTDAYGGRDKYWDPWTDYDIWQFSGWGRFESLGGRGKFDFNSMKKSSLSKLKMP